MFKKLAFFTGWLLVLCLSLLFCFTLGLWQNWSTPTVLMFWVGMLIMAILLWCILQAVGLVIKGKKGRGLLEKYRLSRREYVLREHWKSGASVIRRIRRQRTPLPWYLLVGDRCGKSTLLASAGLPRFDGDTDDHVGGPTRTLKWWFFRRLAILDISSHFLSGNPTFRQAWKKLAHWCTQLPAPAGIIITIPMTSLMSGDRSALHTLARQQRALTDPLVRRFGHRLPIYVMITQCDHFPGFTLWHQQLSASQRQQALGYRWNTPPHIDGQDVMTLQPLFAALQQGMSRVRLSMASPASLNKTEHATLLDFPEAFASLEPALRYTLASLCEPNAYFSHSSLSAVWFTATEPQANNRGRRTGVFIHDLLTQQLPELNSHHHNQHWYQRPRGKRLCTTALAITAFWLAISGVLSQGRLQPTLEQDSPDALAIFLAEDEQYPTFALRFLPFQFLLNQQQRHAEERLALVPGTPHLLQTTFVGYQQQVLAASPVQQRTLILQLADAILCWQQMRNGVPLNTLCQAVPVTEALMQRTYSTALAPLTQLALERHYMQLPAGERWLQTAQRLLSTLVNQDHTLPWLLAPTPEIPGVQAGRFWPSLTASLSLDGIWTSEGNIALHSWVSKIERAAGQPLPVLQQALTRLPTQRQDAWRQYLVEVTANLSATSPATLPRGDLLALGQNQSPAMRFAARVRVELEDISPSETQPWLTSLRQLQQIAVTTDATPWLNRVTKMDQRLRQSLSHWLQNQPPSARAGHVMLSEPLWQTWQTARNRAVQEAVAQGKPSDFLTRGLFAPQDSGEKNPLTAMYPALSALQSKLSPQNADAGINAVWLLYQDDAHSLLANAMAQSACWLNNQWKSTVIWPLGKDAEFRNYEEQQALSQQSVSDFLQGSAKKLLIAANNGPAAAEFGGMKMPLSAEFLQLARQTFSPELLQDLPQRASTRDDDKRAALQLKIDALTLTQSELEKKTWKTTVASQPATVPGGARVIPTGTQLTLNCRNGTQQLSSMNFAEGRDFIWQPGQCQGITLSVVFPDFTASYQLDGDDAWPWFIKRFSTGSALFDSSEFGDSAALLEQLGIKQILVRFKVSSPQELEAAFQEWNARDNTLIDLRLRLASLSEENAVPPRRPLSALPSDIAQCQ